MQPGDASTNLNTLRDGTFRDIAPRRQPLTMPSFTDAALVVKTERATSPEGPLPLRQAAAALSKSDIRRDKALF